MTRVSEDEMRVLVMYANCSMNARKAAKRLFMTAPNLHQVLNRVRERTGKDPRVMWQLVELIKGDAE